MGDVLRDDDLAILSIEVGALVIRMDRSVVSQSFSSSSDRPQYPRILVGVLTPNGEVEAVNRAAGVPYERRFDCEFRWFDVPRRPSSRRLLAAVTRRGR